MHKGKGLTGCLDREINLLQRRRIQDFTGMQVKSKGSAAEQISVYCTDRGAGDSCKFRKNDPLLPRQGVVQYDDEQPSACECKRVVYLYLYLYLYIDRYVYLYIVHIYV